MGGGDVPCVYAATASYTLVQVVGEQKRLASLLGAGVIRRILLRIGVPGVGRIIQTFEARPAPIVRGDVAFA